MPLKENENVEKHTLCLYEGDFKRLSEIYPGISVSLIIRKLVRKHLVDKKAVVDITNVGEVTI